MLSLSRSSACQASRFALPFMVQGFSKRHFFTVIQAYEKGITFTLGKITSEKDPGFRLRIPFFQRMWYADLRVSLVELPKQEIITADNVTILVDGVAQYRIVDPKKAVMMIHGVSNRSGAVGDTIKQIATLKIREVLCELTLNEILHKRKMLNDELLGETQSLTHDWGIELQGNRIKDITFYEEMSRAMAKTAEAERIAQAKIINAQADVKTAEIYQEAAEIYANNPAAMRLRELEAFSRMAAEKSNTLIMVPTKILDVLKKD